MQRFNYFLFSVLTKIKILLSEQSLKFTLRGICRDHDGPVFLFNFFRKQNWKILTIKYSSRVSNRI